MACPLMRRVAEWAEPGENTFMREPLVWETYSQVGGDKF